MQTRAVRQTALTGSGTQNFTSTGFGTPDFAICLAYTSMSDDTDTTGVAECIGFWDGTNQSGTWGHIKDAAGPFPDGTSGQCETYSGNFVEIYNQDRTTQRIADVTNTVTDGIELTWDAAGFDPDVVVILGKLDAGEGVVSGTFVPSSTNNTANDVTTTGITPNCVIVSSHGNDVSNSSSHRVSIGFAVDDGGITQRCVNWMGSWNGGSGGNSDVASSIHNDRVAVTRGGSSNTNKEQEITSMESGKFVSTTRAGTSDSGGGNTHAFIAFQLNNAPDIYTASCPTSTGNWDPYTGSAKPNSVLWITTNHTADDQASETGGTCEQRGWYYANENEQYGMTAFSEDGVASATDVHQRVTSGFLIANTDTGIDIDDDSAPTFDSSGLILDVGTNAAAQAHRIIGLSFLGNPAAFQTDPAVDKRADTRVVISATGTNP